MLSISKTIQPINYGDGIRQCSDVAIKRVRYNFELLRDKLMHICNVQLGHGIQIQQKQDPVFELAMAA